MSNILCYSPTSKETIVEDMAERVAHHKLLKVEQYDIKNCYAIVELAPIARVSIRHMIRFIAIDANAAVSMRLD